MSNIFDNPTLGGEKLSLMLLENEQESISGTSCQKAELTEMISTHLFNKKNKSELDKNTKSRRTDKDKFEDEIPTKPHKKSTDYTNL